MKPDLVIDSREVRAGCIFFAIQGERFDSHTVIKDVLQARPYQVIVERSNSHYQKQKVELSILAKGQVQIVEVEDSRLELQKKAREYYEYPDKKLFNVGVTGTNGKTSTTFLIEYLFQHLKIPTGLMGTILHRIGAMTWSTSLTTSDALTLYSRMKDFVEQKAQATTLEVSSHALDQKRLEDLEFSVVVFTNLTRDHLDYHKTFENYFKAKQKLFYDLPLRQSRPIIAVINSDDVYGQKIKVAPHVQRWTFGQGSSDFQFKIESQSFEGTSFELKSPLGRHKFFLPLIGVHNVYNAVAALATVFARFELIENRGLCEAEILQMSEALKYFSGIPGRLQSASDRRRVFVDYAHTDDALRSVLNSLKALREESQKNAVKIFTIFGCGGNRDKGKRPLMARAALEGSDIVIVTSDNPRFEQPEKIIEDIMAGVPSEEKHRVFVEPDRKKAIARALQNAQKHDVILIAGKGHEMVQIVGDQRLYFNDLEVAQKLIQDAQ